MGLTERNRLREERCLSEADDSYLSSFEGQPSKKYAV